MRCCTERSLVEEDCGRDAKDRSRGEADHKSSPRTCMLDSAPVHCVRIDGYISGSSTSHEYRSRTARIYEKVHVVVNSISDLWLELVI
jgi:hypothetical protein